jgi:hypothetical protein
MRWRGCRRADLRSEMRAIHICPEQASRRATGRLVPPESFSKNQSSRVQFAIRGHLLVLEPRARSAARRAELCASTSRTG